MRRRKTSERRKVTVRLSERVCGRLDVATDLPGVGKSMLVEAALEHFLNPAASLETLLLQRLDNMHAKFDHLERDMRLIAETVALHARYHLAVIPPIPQSQQREAIVRGDERFKVLAEQVDRRVRQGRPLMQETIDRLSSAEYGDSEPARGGGPMDELELAQKHPNTTSERVDLEQTPPAPAEAVHGKPSFSEQPGADRAKTVSDGEPNLRAARNFGPESSTGKLETSCEKPLPKWRLILSVFLPFVAGYYLSFLFRTINASISPALAADFGLGAAETGLLASVYFLVFAGAQIPLGVLLDRYGPRRVQSVLLVIAVGGVTLFGNADSFAELLIGRALIGLGVAASLMAGLKAIVTWFPKDRVAFVNGGMIMLGSLGAVTATVPIDVLLNWIGWRSLFEVLTVATLATAGLIYFAVPEPEGSSKHASSFGKPLTLRSVFSDARFLRIAPLSATCIGSSWAMHSLWAASWLADVEGFDHQAVVNQLFTMAIGISLGALLLGIIADRLRKRGVPTEVLLAVVGALFMLAEIALVLRAPLPSVMLWSVVSVVGAATVLSFAMIADYFPVEIAARANGALNLLHFGGAFAIQYGIGVIVNQWAPQNGQYPEVAYQIAFSCGIALQAAALIWFAVPWLRNFVRYLSASIASPLVGLDRPMALVPVAEGVVLEASREDW
ncbi:MFS transporter [Bradyrhizobium sp.]|uniref:MFS transporter n=1 Tax=Bradyrhizobium sp. TaxID=376 RepID=UPI0029010049|nr:MFS transporter [Bradyrhizobium sp.]MDU1495616.1 MFS transporter [Bradyrhizobium sp.]MDU1545880.1 MFS transporter [Bradyrhizobium sp.]MDU1805217.1 MFS transporter [Bradyrhizobium sp.]MDU3045796.1 MFS transporter [Bradyrhizobium sp.]MDU3098737.1 MFS transporter [Bradyrhizobium sp.]